jgi:hypothetical protein
MDEARQRSEAHVEFTDKDGAKCWLSPKALHHIKHDNLIRDPVGFIEDAFRNTIAIVKRLYRTVVVDSEDHRIKTAYVSDSIKGGEVKWVSPRLMN